MKTALLLLLGGFLCGLHGAEGQDTDLLSTIIKLMTRVQDLETKVQFNQSEVQSLQSEVQALKTQDQNLEAKDQSHQSEVRALKNQIRDLEAKDQSHQSEVQALKTQVQALKTQDQVLNNQIRNLDSKDQYHQSEVQSLKTQMQTLKNSQAQLQNSPRVAFYVGLSSGGEWSRDTTINYDHVWTNVGGAYSTATGKFTAPVRGLYVFSFFVNSVYTIHATLMRNTRILAYALDDTTTITTTWDSSSGVAVVTLWAGDTVYMQLEGQIRASALDNTFSGFLLSPM